MGAKIMPFNPDIEPCSHVFCHYTAISATYRIATNNYCDYS